MADLSKFESAPKLQLLTEIKGARCVMLGSPVSSEHMQPMSPQIDKETLETVKKGGGSVIYFYSDNTSDLGKAVINNPGARVTATHIGCDYQASVEGALFPVEDDPDLIDRFWNPIVASWYPGGKTDDKMLMLKFVPIIASIWASTANPIKFVYETTKANLTDTLPNVGKNKTIAA
jgi:general stress protein 26